MMTENIKEIKERLGKLLNDNRKVEADLLFESSNISTSEYKQMQSKNRRDDDKNIVLALSRNNIELADRLSQSIKDDEIKVIYQKLKKEFQDNHDEWANEQQVLDSLEEHLEAGRTEVADKVFMDQQMVSLFSYRKLKASKLSDWLVNEIGQPCDEDQLKSISGIAKSTLIRARAGSGKTRVLAAKAAELLERYNIKSNDLVVLAFNKKAANEIRERIQVNFKARGFENARTFHSLAYQIVQPTQVILFDGNSFSTSESLSTFIRETIREIWSPLFQINLYRFFRKELQQLEKQKALLSNSDYRAYIDSQREVTLKNERVKSYGEKYIADFLFEHDIYYDYERCYIWDKRPYRPDFFIAQGDKEYVLEHWGVDPTKKAPTSGSGQSDSIDNEKYRRGIKEKREYWKDRGIVLLETSVADVSNMRKNRSEFESELKKKLEEAGIKCKKLDQKEIENRVVRANKSRILMMFSQLIAKAKKNHLTPNDLSDLVGNISDERTKAFFELGQKVFEKYERRKKKMGCIDFDDLIAMAISEVKRTDGKCPIYINNVPFPVRSLKWYLLDEFQDFSPLFYSLLKEIRQYSDNPYYVCVGDDWQAINGFAGSSLEYFQSFASYFDDIEVQNLVKNYRSDELIVKLANRLMAGRGPESIAVNKESDSEVICLDVTSTWVEIWGRNPKYCYTTMRNGKQKLESQGILKGQYLKTCHDILNLNKLFLSNHDDSSVAILARTNHFYFTRLDAFLERLKACFPTSERHSLFKNNKVKMGTVHSYKGLEADIVIVLGVCDDLFPFTHPDNILYEPLGVTEEDILDEERRLFYVALTRASKRLYLLTEMGKESRFIS